MVLGRRVLRRIRWEIYLVQIVGRRIVLDLECGPAKQSRLTERLLPYRHDPFARPLKAQRTGDQILRFAAPARVEPLSGYVVRGRTGLIEESLHYSEDVRIRSQRHYTSPVPTLRQLRRGVDADAVRIDRAVSLRHPYCENYFHATTECLGGLALLDHHGLLDGRRIVVSPALAETAVFQHAATLGALSGHDVLVQDHRSISIGDDVLVPRVGSTGTSYRRTAAFLTAHLPPAADAPDVKLYLTRPERLGRTLRNEAVLRDALGERGYVTVDPGSLPWAEQVELFRAASHVVSVHSSALTNVIFRARGTMKVVEIRVPGRVNPDFERIFVGMGFPHRLVDGRDPSDKGHRPRFDADVPAVLDALDELEGDDRAHRGTGLG